MAGVCFIVYMTRRARPQAYKRTKLDIYVLSVIALSSEDEHFANR